MGQEETGEGGDSRKDCSFLLKLSLAQPQAPSICLPCTCPCEYCGRKPEAGVLRNTQGFSGFLIPHVFPF